MSSQAAMRAEWEALNKQTEGLVPEGLTQEGLVPEAEIPGQEMQSGQQEQAVEQLGEGKAGVTPQEFEESAPDKQAVEQLGEEKAGVTPPPKKDSENFRRLREQNKELARRMAEMEAMLNKANKQEQPEEVVEDINSYELKDDDIAEGKHFKLLNKKVKSLNEALQKERQERDKLAVEARLRSSYPDIFNVVTKDNMELLAEMEPDLVQSIITSPNTYAQHVAAYKLIKKYNIGTQDPYADDKARAQKNMAKPRSAATVAPRQGESPLAEADRFSRGLTKDLQTQLLKEMEDAISNRT